MVEIEVCICTSQRAPVTDVIDSIAAQQDSNCTDVRVAVIGFEEHETSQHRGTKCRSDLKIRYLQVPEPGLSTARNLFLSTSTAEWVVFINHNQFADRRWLKRILRAIDDSDIIIGSTHALIEKRKVPDWLAYGQYHSTPQQFNVSSIDWVGNILMRRSFVNSAALRFLDLESSFSEALFMNAIFRAGARFTYEAKAILYEEVPDEHANLTYLLSRHFNRGRIKNHIDRKDKTLLSGSSCKLLHALDDHRDNLVNRPSSKVIDAALLGVRTLGYISASLRG